MPLSTIDHQAIAHVVDLLRPNRRLLFLTGAGLSADSGLPTYRGFDGLYRSERLTRHGMPIEEALSGPMLMARPDILWEYFLELERVTRGATFNRGHRVIAEMEDHFRAVWTVTQNIDGLHRSAGAGHVIELHGDLHELRCTRCDYRASVPDYARLTVPPRCSQCAGIVRPDVVLFGEEVPCEKLEALWREFAKGFDVVFSVGTSSLFDYITDPIQLAHAAGIPTVEINPEQTPVSNVVDYKICGGAAEVLDDLWECYRTWWPWA
ncbi:MAG TPA: NAD-dependent protein deacylase [Isosphaeraceae bacterium]|nr:NAD-dependent protein deacylase [Isosphaeraceae bacterium]